ncbi:hypothetical protein E2562_018395 [Oryza meyeriana var. granulata]|uniref:RING-type domain-containing protein n=1 Tax=Oryza meyeriana var. granulata TaxID=110450 RepID=A0A6G1D4B6_9ORYZ|nr:hypothetical protein E2562_018395 [Oryza meyeriana var. granulata]
MESMMSALLLLLVPPFVSALLAVAKYLAWPVGSSSMRKLIVRKVAPEQAARNELLRVARYSASEGGGDQSPAVAVDDPECVVCLSGIEEGDEVRELRCRHLFHRGCLDQWLVARPPATCPLCRCRLLTSPAEDADDEEDSDMVLLMAYVRSSSTWL